MSKLIAQAAQDGRLEKLIAGKQILSIWLKLDSDGTKAYVLELCSTDLGKVHFLTLIKSKIMSSNRNKYGSFEREFIRLDEVERFIPVPILERLVTGDYLALLKELTVEQMNSIPLLQKALARRAAGRFDEDRPWHDDDED